jgi:hypothetical protein
MTEVIWQFTREAAELRLANPDFKAYADSYENADTRTQLNAQSEDQEIDYLTKQGYDGCIQHFENMWDSSQCQNIRDKIIFVKDTVNPQVDIQPTGNVRSGCGMWISRSQEQTKTQRANPKTHNLSSSLCV